MGAIPSMPGHCWHAAPNGHYVSLLARKVMLAVEGWLTMRTSLRVLDA